MHPTISIVVAALLLAVANASPVPPILVQRDVTVYGLGQDVAIDAPGVAYHPAYKGFPSGGVGPRQTNLITAMILNFIQPGWVPPGVNPTQCTPRNGQLPVILVPGTTATAYTNWAYLGPKLVDEGFCVYSFNHAPLKVLADEITVGGLAFMGNITDSAYALSAFIDEVLTLTGTDRVDLVGHSQGGGALPFYYFKNIMEGSKVRKNVAIAPSLGTEFHGLNRLFNFVLGHSITGDVNRLASAAVNAASLLQQTSSSEWMQDLHKGGLAVDGIEYINLSTKYDEVLIPYTNCNFEEDGKNITNIVLQDVCSLDHSDHLGLAYSSNVYQIVRNQLLDTHLPIKCRLQLPLIN